MKKMFGLLAVAGLLLIAAPTQQAQALSLANPGAATSAKYASEKLGMTTDVRWHRHHGRRHHGYHRHHWRRHHRHHRRHWR